MNTGGFMGGVEMIGLEIDEKKAALKIIEECFETLEKRGVEGITDLQKKYADKGKQYRGMTGNEVPERYYYFWANHYEIYKGKTITEFTIHHINRRHGLGWALLVTRWVLTIDEINGATIFGEVSD
jgi:hypothetical protein